jgi:RNA polymerase sigma factor (sigma-70 family)
MPDTRRVFLIDDDMAVRDAFSVFLQSAGVTVESFGSAEAFLDLLDPWKPGVLVLDQRMGGMSGLELQAELNARGINFPIIFITGHGDVQMSVSAMKAGAMDFLEKPFSNSELLEAVDAALARQRKNRREHMQRAEVRERFERLTPREKEVMQHIVHGISNKRLAELLSVSNRTIEVHRSRVMHKMQAESLPELVRMATLCGINGAQEEP